MERENDVKTLSLLEWLKARLRRQPEEDGGLWDTCFDVESVDPTVLSEIVHAIVKLAIMAVVCALAIQVSWSIYSAGGLVGLLARAMAALCLSGGSCHVPTLLTSLTLGILIIVGSILIIVSPVRLVLGPSKWKNLHAHVDLVDEKVDALHEHLSKLGMNLGEARDTLGALEPRLQNIFNLLTIVHDHFHIVEHVLDLEDVTGTEEEIDEKIETMTQADHAPESPKVADVPVESWVYQGESSDAD